MGSEIFLPILEEGLPFSGGVCVFSAVGVVVMGIFHSIFHLSSIVLLCFNVLSHVFICSVSLQGVIFIFLQVL